MHFDILVEDNSGAEMLKIIIPKIIANTNHTFRIHSYKGIGHLPKNLTAANDPAKRILLDSLPRLLRGHGNTHRKYPPDLPATVIVVCDLDDRCLKNFREELLQVLHSCDPRPETYFCFAVEETEAWLLGDINAIVNVYPKAKTNILGAYQNDSICGTWEKLADAVYPGGSKKLKNSGGYQIIGKEKSTWAKTISHEMDPDNNSSPSFCYFRDKIRALITNH